jgi:uncharacterized protein YecT (DUF1311 family)
MILMAIFASEQCHSQQVAAKPKKVLTPEQLAYQRQTQVFRAKRLSLQGQAKQIFDAEMAREKAGDCTKANTTYDINVCMERELKLTEQNLKSYEGVVEGLLAPWPEMPGQPNVNSPGPAGPGLTPKQHSEEFERVEKSWRDYREMACTAAFHQFDGGTGGPSFQMQCELRLTRDHMRELDLIYGEELHL